MKFLIVDDSSTIRRIVINMLTKLGYSEFMEAANGREAVDCLAAKPADVVITDWNMPEMSGVDLVKAIRALPATKSIPVLMVTTNAAKEDILYALEAGVNDYMVKPFTPDTLREKIQGVIGR